MSEPRTVKVASVEVKQGGGENGSRSWTKYTLVDGNGEQASTFDGKVGKFLQDHVGKPIDITTEQAGKFTNLLTAVEHVEAPAKTNGNGGYYQQRDPESEMRIAREAALHAVTRLYGGTGREMNDPAGQVLKMADAFVRWVYSGDLVAANLVRPVVTVPSTPVSKVVVPPSRGDLLRRAISVMSANNGDAVAWVNSQGWSFTVSEWTDEQIDALIKQFSRDEVPV